jgi:hypothetical protein
MSDSKFVELCIPDSLRLAKHQDAALVNLAIATTLIAYRKAIRDNVWEKNQASDIARAIAGFMESAYVPHISQEEEDWTSLQKKAEEAQVMKASAAELAKAGGLDTIRTKVIALGDKPQEPAPMPEVQAEPDMPVESTEDIEEPIPEPIECEKKVEEQTSPTLNVTAPRAARFDSKDKGSQLFNIVSTDGRSAAVGAFNKKGPKYYATVDVIVDGGRHKGSGDSAIAAVVDAVSGTQFSAMALSFDPGFDKYVDNSSSKTPEEWHYKKAGDKTCSICGFVGNVKAEHRKRADGRFEKYVKVCFGTDYDIVPIESKGTMTVKEQIASLK